MWYFSKRLLIYLIYNFRSEWQCSLHKVYEPWEFSWSLVLLKSAFKVIIKTRTYLDFSKTLKRSFLKGGFWYTTSLLVKIFRNGPYNSKFFKEFHKFYLVHSWIPWPICRSLFKKIDSSLRFWDEFRTLSNK